ncbi:MAG: SCP2 sterol-binding domain-containing protein [Caulobacterales bacterium]|nr:SCP2 sterol-binding domain-containing protein [Caulobacterales bacterium]
MSADRLARIIARARAALAAEQGFDKRVTLDFGDDGAVHVDGPAGEVRAEAAPADCVVRVSLDDFVAIAKGELDPALAFLRRKVAVEGDAGLAFALAARMRAAED